MGKFNYTKEEKNINKVLKYNQLLSDNCLSAGKLSSAGSDPWCAGNDVHFCIYVSKISE